MQQSFGLAFQVSGLKPSALEGDIHRHVVAVGAFQAGNSPPGRRPLGQPNKEEHISASPARNSTFLESEENKTWCRDESAPAVAQTTRITALLCRAVKSGIALPWSPQISTMSGVVLIRVREFGQPLPGGPLSASARLARRAIFFAGESDHCRRGGHVRWWTWCATLLVCLSRSVPASRDQKRNVTGTLLRQREWLHPSH